MAGPIRAQAECLFLYEQHLSFRPEPSRFRWKTFNLSHIERRVAAGSRSAELEALAFAQQRQECSAPGNRKDDVSEIESPGITYRRGPDG
jgi:hypothetical protein